MCSHQPPCPTVDSVSHLTAVIVSSHPEQGWSLLSDGTIVFDGTGELLPDGRVVSPHRPLGTLAVAA
ncbi:DUF5999 family protein [Streptomyces sp. NBC_00285]|uniref:DUF5999 family protein n=1 Tax=Streptomyces sp. NBC_00285 TaxID=2975700 RepID=UPI002E2D79EF|nr:DUF5999 family protein [Streptomyces sp. NBC_00285]